MSKFTLSALVGAALWAAVLAPVNAQQPARPTPGAAPTPSPETPRLTGENPVVGSVNSKQIRWLDVIAKLKADSPGDLQKAVADVMGAELADSLFGPRPKAQVTYTRETVLLLLRQKPPAPILQAMQNLIRQSVFEQELAKSRVTLTDRDVNDYINQLLKQARTGGSIPADTNRRRLSEITRPDPRNPPQPPAPAGPRPLYLVQKDLEKDNGHAFSPADFVQARHILIKVDDQAPELKPEDKQKRDADALKHIQDIAADIKAGKITFEDAAKKYSDDPSNKEQGGDLGIFTHKMMVPEFEKAAFSMKEGEVSAPIRTSFGYHLIRVEKIGKNTPEADREKLLDKLKQGRFNDYVNLLMSRYTVVNNLQPARPRRYEHGRQSRPDAHTRHRPAHDGAACARAGSTARSESVLCARPPRRRQISTVLPCRREPPHFALGGFFASSYQKNDWHCGPDDAYLLPDGTALFQGEKHAMKRYLLFAVGVMLSGLAVGAFGQTRPTPLATGKFITPLGKHTNVRQFSLQRRPQSRRQVHRGHQHGIPAISDRRARGGQSGDFPH